MDRTNDPRIPLMGQEMYLEGSKMNNQIIPTLLKFAAQKPGISACNYNSACDLRKDYRKVQQQLEDARNMAVVANAMGVSNEEITSEAKGHRIRLSQDGLEVDYVPWQYWCIEYRGAVCRLLANVILRKLAANSTDGNLAAMRRKAREMLGESLVRRWLG